MLFAQDVAPALTRLPPPIGVRSVLRAGTSFRWRRTWHGLWARYGALIMPCMWVCGFCLRLRPDRRRAMAHCSMFRWACRVARWSSWRLLRRRGGCAVSHCCVLRRAVGAGRRRRRWLRCRNGQHAMSHGGVLGRAGGTIHWRGRWRRRWSGERAMTHGGVLGRAAGTGRWSIGTRLGAGLRGRSCSRQQEREDGRHAASPSSGRTLTTRIMPACMW